jgi:hypothetical protein
MPPHEENFMAPPRDGFTPYSFIERGSYFERQNLTAFQAIQLQRRQNRVINTANLTMRRAQRAEDVARQRQRQRAVEHEARHTMGEEDTRSRAAQSHYYRQLDQQLNRGEITQEQYNRLRGSTSKPKIKKRRGTSHSHYVRKQPPRPPRPPGGGGGLGAMTIR